MKRRHALKHLGAGLSAGMFLPWLSSCKEDEIKPAVNYGGTIAVIGAGAAGLYAADYLLSNGLNVQIFEASSRIGGRVRSLRPADTAGQGLWFNANGKLSADYPVELGADRILGTSSSWAKFVLQQQFATLPIEGNSAYHYFLSAAASDYTTVSQNADFIAAETFLTGLSSNAGASQTVQEAILAAGISDTTYPILNAWLANKYGTNNSRLSIGPIADELALRSRGDGDLLLAHNPMVDVLIGSFIKAAEKTQLNTVIKNVNFEGEKVVLTGEKHSSSGTEPFTATFDKVIVTVPISVIQSGDITFTPELPPSKANALSKMQMDHVIRVVLDFRKNFWGDSFRGIYGGTIAPEYFNPGKGRSTIAKTLTATVSGPTAETLSPLGLDMIPQFLSDLDAMFDGQASENLRYDAVEDKPIVAIQDWGKEPYIQGAASYLKPGGTLADRETLSQSILGKLFFAGEATDFGGEAGTVNGALNSAERCAKEIIDLVKA